MKYYGRPLTCIVILVMLAIAVWALLQVLGNVGHSQFFNDRDLPASKPQEGDRLSIASVSFICPNGWHPVITDLPGTEYDKLEMWSRTPSAKRIYGAYIGVTSANNANRSAEEPGRIHDCDFTFIRYFQKGTQTESPDTTTFYVFPKKAPKWQITIRLNREFDELPVEFEQFVCSIHAAD